MMRSSVDADGDKRQSPVVAVPSRGHEGASTAASTQLTRSERKRQHQAARAQAPQAGGVSDHGGKRDNATALTAKKLKRSSFLPLEQGQWMTRRCIIAYDGTRFNGFQAQEKLATMRTVQETIEDAVQRTTGETVRVKGCSRTDKGVHARGQVIVFASQCVAEDRAFRDALNTRLPEDVVCRSMQRIASAAPSTDGAITAFDPRANSTGKIYEYVIVSSAIRPVLDRHRVWFMKKTLDARKMRAAIAHLVALPAAKDYSAFTPPKTSQLNDDAGKGNVCTLFSVELIEEKLEGVVEQGGDTDQDEGVRICIRFHGDRFLYKMVRNLVGTLVDVGLGRMDPEVIPTILANKDRSKAGQGAPPHGLTLVRVLYDSS